VIEPTCYVVTLRADGRTVLARAVRERLKLSPGDCLRYFVDDFGVRIEKGASGRKDSPFACFSEWSSEEDEEAFADL
jgi:bifunctional DNA-binding transcriptional regulator/antitoxin component of YhaV-PrlF toxin-antitoxin module